MTQLAAERQLGSPAQLASGPWGPTDRSTRQATNDSLMHHLGPTCGMQPLSLARLATLSHTIVFFFFF